MENPSPNPNEQYAGPGPAVVVLGNSEKYGWYARLAGIVVGLIGSEGIARVMPGFVGSASRLMERFNIPNQGKTVIRAGGALAGFVVGHWAGIIYGALKARPHRHDGQEQFERIKHERNDALAKVEVLEKKLAEHAEPANDRHAPFTEKHASRAEHGSHAAAHVAEKNAADSAEHHSRG